MAGRAALTAGLILVCVAAQGAETEAGSEEASLGRQLFEESWLRPAADDSPLAPSREGDGLGPLFNAASCVACHRQGGVGGAGPNENNVELVSLVLPHQTSPEHVRLMTIRAGKVHRAFLDGTDITLHRFGRDATGRLRKYESFRALLRSSFPEDVVPAVMTQRSSNDGLTFQLAQRNTPAVFGAGLSDQVPPELVLRLAALQKEKTPGTAGRATDEGAGRFGWRGQVSSLEEFVRTACAAELGLRVHDRVGKVIHDQAVWPLEGPSDPSPDRLRADMSETQVNELVAFIRSLPAPRQIQPDDPEAAKDVYNGEYLFGTIGCAACHVRDMGDAKGIYSDLLLHDMGPMLADRVSAPLPAPRIFSQTIRGSSGGGGYSGGSDPIRSLSEIVVAPPSLGDLVKATQEFRTPPLWGVADSAPYLHDGRAETLDEAIRQHGGQADDSVRRYGALAEDERREVVAFLETLRAPQID